MKYFTREELEDITIELMENPTRETLQKLNEKYNGDPIEVLPQEEVLTPVIEPSIEVANNIPNQVQNIEVPNIENNLNNAVESFQTNSLEVPHLETPVVNNQDNTAVNFSGNLWETPAPEMTNLMQTTDNFNISPNTMTTTNVPIQGVPFFGPIQEPVNNPIPVNNTPIQGPSMFGQIEQNLI